MVARLRPIGRLLVVMAALGAAACMPKGLRLPESPLLSFLERKSGLIAYLGADGNIYVVDQSGQKPKSLTTDAQVSPTDYHVYGVPAWTTDSRRLAFAGYTGQANQDPSENDLIVVDADGAHPVTAYTSPDYLIYYNWAPDGQTVGVLSTTPGQTLALKLVPAAGGSPAAEILDTGNPFYWAWAPDSQSVLVHANGEAGRLAFLRLGASVVERQVPDVTPSAFKAPAYSPDGRQILFAGRDAAGQAALYLADSQGGGAQRVQTYSDDIAFAWSPDGQRAAYIASTQFAGPLAVLNPARPADPVTTEASAYAFFWSPDSRSLAYFTTETITATTGSGADSNTPATQTVWALNVLDAASGGTRQLARFQPTDRFLQVLPYFDQYHQSFTIWSPDSQYLVVAAYTGDGQPGIFVVPASGNIQPRYIAAGLIGVWSWR